MSENNAVEISNLTKYFALPHQKAGTLKSFFVNPFTRYENERQLAFRNISVAVKKGEFFGIVGRNGSGKSTLLKCMAGVYTPDEGSIKIQGTLVPFIELGVGFNPQLSGRDNVFLNGALLGFNRKEIGAMYDDIVEFAELEKFMDQKLKNYSSGMQVRLAFSIAIRARGDILLLDEVLAVGDSAFQQKCFDYFDTIKEAGKTIILVTHSMGIIEKYCQRALFLENGKVKFIGPSSEVARMYEEMFIDEEIAKRKEERKNPNKKNISHIDETVKVKKVSIVQDNKISNSIKALRPFEVVVDFESSKDIQKSIIRMNIKNRQGQVVIATDSEDHIGIVPLIKNKKQTLKFMIENNLTNGMYIVNLSFSDVTGKAEVGLNEKKPAHEFDIKGIKKYTVSITHPKISVKIEDS